VASLAGGHVANRVADDQQGLVQGVIASLASAPAVVAPLVLTGVFEWFVKVPSNQREHASDCSHSLNLCAQ
jgi:hypothetical protein